MIHQCGFNLPVNALATAKKNRRKNDGKIQSGHFRVFGSMVAMATRGACTNIQNRIFRVWEASVQRGWWLTFWHQLLSCDTAIITSGKTKSLRDVLLLHQQKKLFSSIFCQAWAFSSFLCVWRVPRRHVEGLRRHCVRDQNEGGRSAERSLAPS